MSMSAGRRVVGSLRLAFVGWGSISRRVARLLSGSAAIDIVAVAVRDISVQRSDLPERTRLIAEPTQLAGLGLDLVIEAAGRDTVAMWGRAALAAGCDFAVCSTSAFTEDSVLTELLSLAEENGCHIIVPPGALAGVDGLAAASALDLEEVEHTITKPAAAWKGTAAEQMVDLDQLSAPTIFFEGTARVTATRFPQNANVAVVTSLAGLGLDRTHIVLIADPAATRNTHRIRASGAFGKLDARIENEPLATNPKSSEMTALGLVRLIQNRVSLVVC